MVFSYFSMVPVASIRLNAIKTALSGTSPRYRSSVFGSVERVMNLHVLTKTMKIIQYTKDPASGPLFRHGGRGVFNFFVTDRRRGAPSGAAAFIVTEELK